MCAQYRAKAPGSFMLMGEHAVLRDKHALVCAANYFINVKLTPRSDDKIIIHSETLGDFQTNLTCLKIEAPFQFILASALVYKDQLSHGFDLVIESEFSHQVGLGSSAAVTVAFLKVISAWLQKPLNDQELFLQARSVIRMVQGMGSGADVAASVFGGSVFYRDTPLVLQSLSIQVPMNLIYVGYKTPTAEVVNQVNRYVENKTEYYANVFHKIDICVTAALTAIKLQDWVELGYIMNQHQVLQNKLGVCDNTIEKIITYLMQQTTIFGAKISGSGLGDCIVALGVLPQKFNTQEIFNDAKISLIPVEIAREGASYCE